MAQIQISAKRKDDAAATNVNYELGTTVDELVTQFGADVVATKARQSIIIDAQSFIRRQITPGKDGVVATQEQVQAAINGWKPDNRVVTKQSAGEKAKAAIGTMSPDERKALLKQLKEEGLV
jgi:hypothetical protein